MNIQTGTFLGRVPFARVGATPDPILVAAGGQAFVQRATPERIARDAGRIARILPAGRSFVLIGYDPAPPDPHPDAMARDLADILDEHPGATLLGISYGGLIALRAAAQRPVGRLILLVSAHDFSAEGKARVREQIAHAERGDLVALTECFAAVFRRRALNWLLRLRLRTMRARLPELLADPALIARRLRAVVDHPLDPAALAGISAPTTLVCGARDQFFGDGMPERTAAALPHATLHLVRGETHMLPVERARHVARLLRSAL